MVWASAAGVVTVVAAVAAGVTAYVNLERDVADLRKQLAASSQLPKGAAAIPSGAVVAFATDTECWAEKGWSKYQESEGRFIIGVGKGPLQETVDPGDVGGEEEHILAIAEIPAHSHQVIIDFVGTVPPSSQQGRGPLREVGQRLSATPGIERRDTALSGGEDGGRGGGTVAHNNMPPYIALYFCKKD